MLSFFGAKGNEAFALLKPNWPAPGNAVFQRFVSCGFELINAFVGPNLVVRVGDVVVLEK